MGNYPLNMNPNHGGSGDQDRSYFPVFLGVAIFLFLAGIVGWRLLSKPWTGMRVDGPRASRAGSYRTLDKCKLEIEKTGGWCGEDCKDYGNGTIADCNPNLSIPKK